MPNKEKISTLVFLPFLNYPPPPIPKSMAVGLQGRRQVLELGEGASVGVSLRGVYPLLLVCSFLPSFFSFFPFFYTKMCPPPLPTPMQYNVGLDTAVKNYTMSEADPGHPQPIPHPTLCSKSATTCLER